MSRHQLRHEKNCLNCGHLVEERYCTRCGQENLEPTESFSHIVGHFFADITHFDSKFFVTVKDLLLRPGFLTREYVAGRRMTYLNPIRMYIFISALFFLALFTGRKEYTPPPAETAKQSKHKDESVFLRMGDGVVIIDMTENKYNTVREFDSLQAALPDSAKEKGIMHWVLRHNVGEKEKRGTSKIHIEVDISHDVPKLMFLLLPLFALYVGWFYSRKRYFYVNHAIFSVHFHSFVFLLMLFFILLSKLIPGDWIDIFLGLTAIVLSFIYLVAALHGMYGQSFWQGLFKGIGISLLYVLTLGIASTILMIGAYVFL
ncbi:MAG TPA: DUF3667 domain-containing protein [Puia sp.]|uniref:DUF3667 domain-containing protein n=1 Tax=Puia sp. TaxID=2045100 RepID=UPI002D09EA5B|nr:DUF3667 domain-containing protein [Puia sp.]HVU93874.1 DUF3667 domain-containing protein [Puia sp.]